MTHSILEQPVRIAVQLIDLQVSRLEEEIIEIDNLFNITADLIRSKQDSDLYDDKYLNDKWEDAHRNRGETYTLRSQIRVLKEVRHNIWSVAKREAKQTSNSGEAK